MEGLSTKKEKLARILGKLKDSDDVEGTAVITRDGLLVVSFMNENIDELVKKDLSINKLLPKSLGGALEDEPEGGKSSKEVENG